MVLRSERPILNVELASMHTIDTSSAENLFSLWSIFNKISGQVEDGKRLENLSWRIWARESPVVQPSSCFSRWVPPRRNQSRSLEFATEALPELSSSVESTASSIHESVVVEPPRPVLRRANSVVKDKHITPIDLEKIVISIKEKKDLEPLSPLPFPSSSTAFATLTNANTHPEDSTPRTQSPPQQPVAESSTSTIATAPHSLLSDMSPSVGSETSVSSEESATSVVRGFTRGKSSVSMRSSSNLASAPAPILKNSSTRNIPAKAAPARKAKFVLGGSEGDESSLESRYLQPSITPEHVKKPTLMKKVTSFKEEVTTYNAKSSESESAIESDSAIETDDEDESWEDEEEDDDDDAISPADEDADYFHKNKVSHQTKLPSRPSLISLALDPRKGRAEQLQNMASRSTPALRRSRTSSPNGPSLATSPEDEAVLEMKGGASRPRPIIMTTSNTMQPAPAISPRTTRRLMLQQELPESLRKHMVWERQQRNKTNAAALKRRHTAQTPLKDLKALPAEPNHNPHFGNASELPSSWSAYFDAGNEQEYHSKGW